MSVEIVSAMFTGLTGLLAAIAALLANRSRRVTEDSRLLRRQVRQLQRKVLAALQHIFALEHELAERGIRIPARPEILEADDEDDGPTPQTAGSHAAP